MNGVFKFKENLFLRYKKEIMLTVGAVVTMATVVRFVPGDDKATENTPSAEVDGESQTVAEVVKETNGFTVSLDGVVLGTLASMEEGQTAINEAIGLVIETLGYDPEVLPELTYDDNYALDAVHMTTEALAATLKDDVIGGLDKIKVKAYVMKIGDDFTVAMNSEDEIEEVLKNAQSIYINSEDMALDIELARDNHNSLVMTPQVTMVKAEASQVTRTFTAGETSEDSGSDEEGSTPKEVVEKEKDPTTDGETVAIDFAEEVMVVETYVYEDEIEDVHSATELITKENDEPKIYTVKSGDVPSIIAENNDMNLSELYTMNPDLKGNERKMQIGDELIVMIPEPELSVSTKEQVEYTEPIYKGITYVDNAKKYQGWTETVSSGSNGTMVITALVSKVNGDETGREIIDRTVRTEPVDKVVARGTKPLPPKGATGKYIPPLSEYRVTSPFGYRWGGFHYGIDLAAPTGTPVLAADGGVVTKAGWHGNYGYLVEINHGNGVRTRYGHNSKIKVSIGQQVSQYETIALCGNTGRSTGPHVHFEIRFDGVPANPKNYVDF